MTKKKNAPKGNRKKSAKTIEKPGKKVPDIGTAAAEVCNESEHGQAWERGESIPLAKNESDPLLEE